MKPSEVMLSGNILNVLKYKSCRYYLNKVIFGKPSFSRASLVRWYSNNNVTEALSAAVALAIQDNQ